MSLSERLQAERQAKQARMAQRQPRQPKASRVGGLGMFAKLYGASTEPVSKEQSGEIIMPYLASIESLRTGRLNAVQFLELSEANCAGFCLSGLLYRFGTPQTKQLLEPTEPIFLAASQSLLAIGERFNKKGKYGATGEELGTLRDSARMFEELMGVSNQGHLLTALQQAARMVDERLMEMGVMA